LGHMSGIEAISQVPNKDLRITASGSQQPAIMGKCQGEDRTLAQGSRAEGSPHALMAAELAALAARCNLPHTDRALVVRVGQQSAGRKKCQRPKASVYRTDGFSCCSVPEFNS